MPCKQRAALPLSFSAPSAGFHIAAFLKFCPGRADREVHRRQKAAFYANIGKHQLRFLRWFKGCLVFTKRQCSYRIWAEVLSLQHNHTLMLRSWKYLFFHSSLFVLVLNSACSGGGLLSKGVNHHIEPKNMKLQPGLHIRAANHMIAPFFHTFRDTIFPLHLLHNGC